MEWKEQIEPFVKAMVAKLEMKEEEGAHSWDSLSPQTILKRLHQEFNELQVAVNNLDGEGAMGEAVDIADFCLFLFLNLTEGKRLRELGIRR